MSDLELLEKETLNNPSENCKQSKQSIEHNSESHPDENSGNESDDSADDVGILEPNEEKCAKCNWYELACTVFAGILFLMLRFIPWKLKNGFYIVLVFVSFGSYCIYKCKCYGFELVTTDWGLRCHNFKISFMWCSLVSALGVIVMLIWMAIFKTGLPFHYNLILMLLLYPLWGIIQQFLIQSLIAVNLSKTSLNYYLIILLTSCAFTLVHFPNWLLMLATFAMAAMFTPIFLKYKCLYPLGLYHGWNGALFYWLVLEDDPIRRFTYWNS